MEPMKKPLMFTKQMEEDNIKVKEDTAAMNKELSSKSGDMGVYQQRQAAALERKAKAEESLANKNQELSREESGRIDLQNEKKKMESGVGDRKKGVDDVRMSLQKVENDKNSRDHTMKGLNDEIADQDEVINRLNKEKKMVAEHSAKSSEDLLNAEEKVNHLISVKNKLEGTLDELEGCYEKEKRARATLEKEKRKV